MTDEPDLTYGRHLNLDRLLSALEPVSGYHDETLFIIQHQTSELWMRLIIEELFHARRALEAENLPAAVKALRRVVVVFDQLIKSWDVLRTLTPSDFAAFRGSLGTASGFQSGQYRLIEFVLGNREAEKARQVVDMPDVSRWLAEELEQPSLYQVALNVLARRLDVNFPKSVFAVTDPSIPDPSVEAAWRTVISAPENWPGLVELADVLVEIEDRFRCWRFNHVTTVERVIGNKTGTGGTSGVTYLRKRLDIVLFPELWSARSVL